MGCAGSKADDGPKADDGSKAAAVSKVIDPVEPVDPPTFRAEHATPFHATAKGENAKLDEGGRLATRGDKPIYNAVVMSEAPLPCEGGAWVFELEVDPAHEDHAR